MPFEQCADGAETGSVRDIAVLTRVGRPTCFVIEELDTDEAGQPCYRLSRAEAQRMCKADYLDTLRPGDILPCTVTHIEPFGAFCDVGCGISALLPIDCMSAQPAPKTDYQSHTDGIAATASTPLTPARIRRG